MNDQRHDRIVRNDAGDILGLEYQGEFYPLLPLDDGDFEYVEQYLLDRRRNPLEAIKKEFDALKDSPRLQEMLVDRAYRSITQSATTDSVSRTEVKEFLDTRDGAILTVWLMVRKHKPDITLDYCKTMFRSVSTDEVFRRRDEVNAELTRRANLDGAGASPADPASTGTDAGAGNGDIRQPERPTYRPRRKGG